MTASRSPYTVGRSAFRGVFSTVLCASLWLLPAKPLLSAAFFCAGSTYVTGDYPTGCSIADFNRDGIGDLAVANYLDDTVLILLGNGDGTFDAEGTCVTGSGPVSVAVEDFDGDGKADLAVANEVSCTVSTLLGNGDGTFREKSDWGTGLNPNFVAMGDFDGDGNVDLAVTNLNSTSVSVLLGDGEGSFSVKNDYTTGNAPMSVAVGDFNGDGKADLAVANYWSHSVSVLLGNGDGTFADKADCATGDAPRSVAVGDFSGDGHADLAVANFGPATVSILLGNGNGMFQEKIDYPSHGTDPCAVETGDFNGDGIVDLAVANCYSGTVSILTGSGAGTFQWGETHGVGNRPFSLAMGDFNGDGRADLAVTDPSSDYVLILLNTWVPLRMLISPPAGGTTSPAAGAHGYDPGAVVPLTAAANPGWTFTGWSGGPVADHHAAATTVTMDASRTVVAHFAPRVLASARTSHALPADGTVRAWGYNSGGKLGDGTQEDRGTPVRVLGTGGIGHLSGAVGIAGGTHHVVAVMADGTVRAWGGNYNGQLGDGTTARSLVPLQVLGLGGSGFLTGIVAVACGWNHSVALKSDGTVWTWGYNPMGQLGDGTTEQKTTPVPVVDPGGAGVLTKVVAVAAGAYHTVALRSDGTVWAWGWNFMGVLGDGTLDNYISAVPVPVVGPEGNGFLSGVAMIAAGSYRTLALMGDGTVRSWGENPLGDGTASPSGIPVRAVGTGGAGWLEGAAAVGGGMRNSAVLLCDGTVRTWGYNPHGQLGNSTTTASPVSVQVVGPENVGVLTDIRALTVAAGDNVEGYHLLAVRSDGTLWGWGRNFDGELGDGTKTNSLVPVQVGGLNVLQATYTVSGRVSLVGGAADVTGVTVSLTGDAALPVHPDVDGDYSFAGLAPGTYLVTPTLAGYEFGPVARSYDPLSQDCGGQDYTGIYQCALTVASDHGSPNPAVGGHTRPYGTSVTASVVSPVTVGSTRYVCTGYTGTGSAPSGAGLTATFTITEDSTLTWNWATEYYLTTAADPAEGGTVTPANGWYAAGTPVSVQAFKNAGWEFTGWTGDAGGVANPVSVTMSGPKSVTGVFEGLVALSVVSSRGVPVPGLGVHTYVTGTEVTASVASPVAGPAGTRYVCTGYTGTGSAPSGSGLTATFTITENSTLTWNWTTEYYLTTAADPVAGGSVVPASGWYAAGTPVNVQANPNGGWVFSGWSGAAGGLANPVSITMDGPKSITGSFLPLVGLTVTSSRGAPLPEVGAHAYVSGTSVTASVVSPVTVGSTRYVCTGYTGTGSVPSSGTDLSVTFTITEGSSITWNWRTEHLLTIVSARGGDPQGGGWYEEGATAHWSVTSPVAGVEGTRYEARPDSGDVAMDEPKTVTVAWTTRHELTIVSARGGNPQGADWYDEGTTAHWSVTSPVAGAAGTQYEARPSSGDVVMDAPKTVTVAWTTQHELTVTSDHGTTTGSGWYDEGTTAGWTVTTPVSGGEGIRYTAAPAAGSVLMDGPKTVAVTWWTTEYALTTAADPAEGGDVTPGGWYADGTVVEVAADPAEGWALSGWTGGATGTVSPVFVAVNGPTGVTAHFVPLVDLTVASPRGSPSPGVGSYSYPSGTSVTASVTSPVTVGSTRYVCTGYTGTGSAPSGAGLSVTFTIAEDSTITWNWRTEHFLTIVSARGGDPQGAGWYEEGVTAGWSVTSPVAGGAGTRYEARPASGSVTMTGPRTVTVNWVTQHLLSTAATPAEGGTASPASGWYDAGSVEIAAIANPGWGLLAWSGDASGRTTPQTLLLDGPKSVTATFDRFYTLSGTVTLTGGGALPSDVLVTVSGQEILTVRPDGDGRYAVSVLAGSWSVTPALAGYVFSPQTRAAAVAADVAGLDFTGSLTNPVMIMGYVKTPSGTAIPNVPIVFSNRGGRVLSGANGYYAWAVPRGWSGTATPELAGSTFVPASRSYANMTYNKAGQNYAGGVAVSGYVRSPNGQPVPGATVTFSGNAGQTTTDAVGYYSVFVTTGWSGTVTPARSRCAFDPPSRTYGPVTVPVTDADFAGYVYLSGYVRTASGTGIPGTVLAFSGDGGSASSDTLGYYENALVPYGWSGTVTPILAGYSFTPASRTHAPVTAGLTNQNFAGMTTVTVSGTVREEGTGLAGVTVTFVGGGTTVTATTDAVGHYEREVPENWSGTVTPAKTGYLFDPARRSYTYLLSSVGGQDYAARRMYAISGSVKTAAGAGVGGVTLAYAGTYAGGAFNGSVNTASSGAYAVTLPGGWTGTFTAAKAGYIITPTGKSYTAVGTDLPGEDYVGALAVTISGYVKTAAGAGIGGTTVSLTGGYTASSTASGYYAVLVPYGWSGMAFPNKAGYNFTPVSRAYANLTYNKAGQNYTGF